MYIGKLREKGYTGIEKRTLNQKDIAHDFLNYYPIELLSQLNANVNIEDRNNWLRSITTNSQKFIHPIKHILFINFLFGDIESFVLYSTESENTYKPFGESPWPCLNPVSENYKKAVVVSHSQFSGHFFRVV